MMADWQSAEEDKQVSATDQETVKEYKNTTIDEALRRKLHSSYTFVRSSTENTKIFTLDHLIQERLDMLTAGTKRSSLNTAENPFARARMRISRLDLLDTLLEDTKNICKSLETKGEGK